MTMLLFTWTLFILITFAGFCYTFGGKTMNDRSNGAKVTSGGKTMNDRSNGAKVTSAGLLALSILIAFGV